MGEEECKEVEDVEVFLECSHFSIKPAGETAYATHLFAILLNGAICKRD